MNHHPFKPDDLVYCEGRTSKGKHLNGKWWRVKTTYFCGTTPYMTLHGDPKSWGMYGFSKEGIEMLHIAIKLRVGDTYQTIVERLNDNSGIKAYESIADSTPHALKERLKARIAQYPEERWLILSGNVIAETSAPPVSFHQW